MGRRCRERGRRKHKRPFHLYVYNIYCVLIYFQFNVLHFISVVGATVLLFCCIKEKEKIVLVVFEPRFKRNNIFYSLPNTFRWMKLGIGPVKILRSKSNPERLRLVQRRESFKNGPATKVILNVPLWKESSIQVRTILEQRFRRKNIFTAFPVIQNNPISRHTCTSPPKPYAKI
jgi:hypothetical protein